MMFVQPALEFWKLIAHALGREPLSEEQEQEVIGHATSDMIYYTTLWSFLALYLTHPEWLPK